LPRGFFQGLPRVTSPAVEITKRRCTAEVTGCATAVREVPSLPNSSGRLGTMRRTVPDGLQLPLCLMHLSAHSRRRVCRCSWFCDAGGPSHSMAQIRHVMSGTAAPLAARSARARWDVPGTEEHSNSVRAQRPSAAWLMYRREWYSRWVPAGHTVTGSGVCSSESAAGAAALQQRWREADAAR